MSKDTRFWGDFPAKLCLVVAAVMLTPAVALANTEDTDKKSAQSGSPELQQLAEQETDLTEFVNAIERSGLASSLTGDTEYTIFAPTNDAFESDSSFMELLESGDQQRLVEVLRAHIVADDVDPEMAKTIGEAQTIDGGTVLLSAEGEELKVGDASVVTADIQQGNLRIYSIDAVLAPSATASMASTETGQSDDEWSTASETAMSEADFDQLDEDGDGYLSEDEMQVQQDLAAEHGQLDSDADGRISRTEFAVFEEERSSDSSTSEQSGSESTDPQPPETDE
jgi:uncharacterized surface protein with fasciclin (FAS1) repeats